MRGLTGCGLFSVPGAGRIPRIRLPLTPVSTAEAGTRLVEWTTKVTTKDGAQDLFSLSTSRFSNREWDHKSVLTLGDTFRNNTFKLRATALPEFKVSLLRTGPNLLQWPVPARLLSPVHAGPFPSHQRIAKSQAPPVLHGPQCAPRPQGKADPEPRPHTSWLRHGHVRRHQHTYYITGGPR